MVEVEVENEGENEGEDKTKPRLLKSGLIVKLYFNCIKVGMQITLLLRPLRLQFCF